MRIYMYILSTFAMDFFILSLLYTFIYVLIDRY